MRESKEYVQKRAPYSASCIPAGRTRGNEIFKRTGTFFFLQDSVFDPFADSCEGAERFGRFPRQDNPRDPPESFGRTAYSSLTFFFDKHIVREFRNAVSDILRGISSQEGVSQRSRARHVVFQRGAPVGAAGSLDRKKPDRILPLRDAFRIFERKNVIGSGKE